MKTVVAFLNTEGGTLLIGVNDNGEILGVEDEIRTIFPKYKGEIHSKVKDDFKLLYKNLLKEHVGEEFYGYIEWELLPIDGKLVLEVVCQRSNTPCFLDDTKFFIRTNPSTDMLEGTKLMKYVETHFER